jgi:DNA-binding transcriptional ArsR family regulator
MKPTLPGKGAALLSALADPTRKQILNLLLEKPLVVKVIAADLPISQSAVSQHLKVMKEAGLVREEKQGRTHLYSVNPGALDWLSWQFGVLRDDLLNLDSEQDSTNAEQQYDAIDIAMDEWAQQWPQMDPVANGLMVRLLMIGRHLDRLFERVAGIFDLTRSQVILLSTLERLPNGECSLNAISLTSFTQTTATQRHLIPLQERGLVRVTKQGENPSDAMVAITGHGRETLHKVFSYQREHDMAPLYAMSGEDRLRLAKLVRPLLRDLQEAMLEEALDLSAAK